MNGEMAMNSVRRPLTTAFGAATAAAVCAGMLTVPVHQDEPQIMVREVPVVLQALTINDIVTRVSDAITYGFAVAPVWYLGLPLSIPMSIGIGFGLADLIPVVGDAFGFTWTLDQVGRTLVGIGLSALVYAVGPPFMAVSSLLGITYPSVLPAAARPAAGSRANAAARQAVDPVASVSKRAPKAAAEPGAAPARVVSRAKSARVAKASASPAASRAAGTQATRRAR